MNKQKISVLGCGLVGSLIAAELSKQHFVTAVDLDETKLEGLKHFRGKTKKANVLKNSELKSIVENEDMIVLAVPGFMGFKVLKSLLELGKYVVDISFFPEDAQPLDKIAKENNCFAVVDCGVAPGFSHMVAGKYANEGMDSYKCMVGGLPIEQQPPFSYKAPFSPIDVIEEYTRPARVVRNKQEQIEPPLTDYELVEFDKVGLLEAFVSDGLRSLISSYPKVDSMIEKTLRYPGHMAAVKVLIDAGFLSDEGPDPTPLEYNSKILFNNWQLNPEDEEFTIMRMEVKGEKLNKTIELFDKRDTATGFSSMARTTGYTCCAAVEEMINKKEKTTGIIFPEKLGEDTDTFKRVWKYLTNRGIEISEK